MHDIIRTFEITDDAVVDVAICRLAQKVAAKEKACTDLLIVEVMDKLITRERRTLADEDGEAEPTRLGVRCGFWQKQKLLKGGEFLLQVCKIRAASFNERVDLFQLCDTHRGLHVRYFEVVTNM